jgi:hypothetical protein
MLLFSYFPELHLNIYNHSLHFLRLIRSQQHSERCTLTGVHVSVSCFNGLYGKLQMAMPR